MGNAGTYNVSPPPYTADGMVMSAYMYNQMVDYLNGMTDFVYGANIPRFRWKFGNTVPPDVVWMMQRKYNQLAIYGNFTPTGSTVTVKVYLKADDVNFTESDLVFSQAVTAGMRTITIDLTTAAYSPPLESIYFIKFGLVGGHSDWQIERIEERGVGLIAPPVTIPTLSSGTIITASYINDYIIDSMRNLGKYTEPYNRPFQAPAMRDRTLEDGANGIFEWKINRVNRYLHIGFKTGSGGGGTDAWRININGTRLLQGSNDSFPRDFVVDLQGMTTANGYLNNITAPAVGAEYSINFYVEQAGVLPANGFRMNYMWELPFAS